MKPQSELYTLMNTFFGAMAKQHQVEHRYLPNPNTNNTHNEPIQIGMFTVQFPIPQSDRLVLEQNDYEINFHYLKITEFYDPLHPTTQYTLRLQEDSDVTHIDSVHINFDNQDRLKTDAEICNSADAPVETLTAKGVEKLIDFAMPYVSNVIMDLRVMQRSFRMSCKSENPRY